MLSLAHLCSPLVICLVLLPGAGFAWAHDVPGEEHPRPEWLKVLLAQTSPSPDRSAGAVVLAASAAGPVRNAVSITTEDGYRVIKSNGWPDHAPGVFPRRGNPNTAAPQSYTFRMPLKPVPAATPQRGGGWWWGVALNGVPFEPGTGETWNNDPQSGWRYEAATGFLDLGLDEHHAHVQPNGAYHYHALPTGLVERLGGDARKMLQIGWAADGFPLYTNRAHAEAKDATSPLRQMKSSYRLKQGARPAQAGGPGGKYDGRFTQDFEYVAGAGDLDECNGRFGVTPEFPAGTYYYCISAEFPFVGRLWRGTPDPSFQKAGGPPGGRPGGPPRLPLFEALDLNQDGLLDAGEIAKAPESLKTLDRNGDGKLTPDEYRPGPPPEGR
jgi:hypothetical protein